MYPAMFSILIRSLLNRSIHCALAGALALAAVAPARADVPEVLKRIQRDGEARVIVRMKADTGAAAWSPTQSAPRQRAAVAAALENVRPALRTARLNGYRSFRTLPLVATTVTQEQLMSLAAASDVESIFLVQKERRMTDVAPGRTLERQQLAGSVPSIDVLAAWAKGYEGAGTAVAVIDGGFNLNHPMLNGKNVGDACLSSDFGTTTKNKCPSGKSPEIAPGAASNCPPGNERCDHGTHVASIAVGNDGVNFGVARAAKVVPIDVFSVYTDAEDCSPDPAPCEFTDSLAALDALDYVNERAVELKIAAVNISFGGSAREGYCDDDPRKGVIDMLRQKGIAVVAAAGNEGLTGKIIAPACVSTAVAVGASNDGTTIYSASNFSANLDFMAPGVNILAASGSGIGRVNKSGTSMSAPHVAGAWAVMRSAFPNSPFDQLEQALKQTGIAVTRLDSGIQIPKIQVAAAIDRLKGTDRRIFNHMVSSGAPTLGESFLRIYNDSAAPGTVTVTLRDVATGAALGKWTSPRISAHAAPQVALRALEEAATPTGSQAIQTNSRAYYNLEVASTFTGYLQHVLWARGPGIFANLSSCAGGLATDSTVVSNVHASNITNYPSRLRIVNTGATTDHAELTIYNASTGAEIGLWRSLDIAPGASLEVQAAQIEDQVPALRAAISDGLSQFNVRLSNLAGYIQHVVENRGAGALVDMSSKCVLGVTGATSSGAGTPGTSN